jgi:GR25 family glycosyltransferase involved in LPS biosynthesis
MFYVINLLRRSDRKTEFLKKIEETGLSLDDVEVTEAVDGTEVGVSTNIIGITDDYDGNPRIAATVQSHYNVWKKIANNPDSDFGVVMEDDIFFHPEFKKNWVKLKQKLKSRTDKIEIIYIGMGDFLPIHTAPPSMSLLKAQEKAHVIKGSIEQGVVGKINTKSAYIFDWFGAFSYIISKETAKNLIHRAETNKISKAVDVWLKNLNIEKRVSIPLLTFHSCYDQNLYDSDTWGITKPCTTFQLESKKYHTAFLIPTYGRVNQLKLSVESIMVGADYPLNILMVFKIDEGDYETSEFVRDLKKRYPNQICITNGPHKKRNKLNEMYNTSWRCYTKVADFFVVWEDDKIINKGWDTTLFKYYESYNKPDIACFQIQSNINVDCDVKNKNKGNGDNSQSSINFWDFSTPFLTKELLMSIDCVSPSSNIREYLRYVSYLSRITIFIRDITTSNLERSVDEGERYTEVERNQITTDFYDDKATKIRLSNDVLKIRGNRKYKTCGLWIPIPDNWSTTETIGESKLQFGDKSF